MHLLGFSAIIGSYIYLKMFSLKWIESHHLQTVKFSPSIKDKSSPHMDGVTLGQYFKYLWLSMVSLVPFPKKIFQLADEVTQPVWSEQKTKSPLKRGCAFIFTYSVFGVK